jgi:adenylylsulfate kinase-like enzyme
MSRIARWLDAQGVNVVVANISIDPKQLLDNRAMFKDYFEVFIDVPIADLIRRDEKNLYRPALEGKLRNVVGVDIPYETPLQPDLTIDNSGFSTTPEEWVRVIADAAGIALRREDGDATLSGARAPKEQ